MKNLEGYQEVQPIIEKIGFSFKDKIAVYLKDGRVLLAPLDKFPSIAKLNSLQRRHLSIIDDQLLMFKDCDEVFHLEQFMGREQKYKYSLINQ